MIIICAYIITGVCMKRNNDHKSFLELLTESLFSVFTSPFSKESIEPIKSEENPRRNRLSRDYERKSI